MSVCSFILGWIVGYIVGCGLCILTCYTLDIDDDRPDLGGDDEFRHTY